MAATAPYDALLVVSFGGPEGPDEVLPFLHNVTRGRTVPPERLAAVARHYARFGGVSPLNGQNRELVASIAADLAAHDLSLGVYWGNRNWHPFLAETVHRMACDGVQRALAFVTSAYSSYSGCRQYREDIARAQAAVGQAAPAVDKLRSFHDHPGFVAANAEHARAARATLPEAARATAHTVFTAHSLPVSMAAGSAYTAQLAETAGLVAAAAELGPWTLAWQSASGAPGQPWLAPDIVDHLTALHEAGVRDVVLAPIGFVSDHMEVVYDLDTEAQAHAATLGLRLARAATAGTHPAFVAMVRELVTERLDPAQPRRALGRQGPAPDVCPADCCLPGGAARARSGD